MFSTLNESGHPCDETIIYHRTRGGGRTKVRKQRKIHSARRALWRRFAIFGVDWELMDMRDKIADMKHARRTSNQKCIINDAQERVINNLKLKSQKIDKQPELSVKPRLCTFNVEAKMFHIKGDRSSQMKFKASSKRKSSSISPTFVLKTSRDVVTHFFFPFTGSGKVASPKKLTRKKSSLSEEDIICRKVSDFLYWRSRQLRRKKKPRNGQRREGPSRNVFPQGNAKKRGLRSRKIRKKKKPGIKSERVHVKQPHLHQGPRYNITFDEVNKAYGRMRKGRGFFASRKVLWRNRHALVLGSSNFYKKVRDDDYSYYHEDNKEYDVVEPPDPEVPTSGPEFSSDYATNGPVPEYDVVEPTEPSPDPAVPTSVPEYSCDYSGNGREASSPDPQVPTSGPEFSSDDASNGPVQPKYVGEASSQDPQVPTSGPEFSSDDASNGPVQPKYVGEASQGACVQGGSCDKKNDRDSDHSKQSSVTVDRLLEKTLMNVGDDQTECGLLTLSKPFDGRERYDDLRKQINKLERMIENGQGNVCLRAMLRSKKNQLHQNMCRSSPSTPTESEDEEQDEPYVAYDGEDQCDGKTFVNYINGGQGVDDDNVESIIVEKENLKIRESYMENEFFLSKNCYGGGKRKRNDSDLEYDPEEAKKRKVRQ